MIMNEEHKMSLEAGELIHTIANKLVDGTIQIEGVNSSRVKLIMELSEALRQTNSVDSNAPLLLSEGFRISQYPRSAWIDLASRLLDTDTDTPLLEIIQQVRN